MLLRSLHCIYNKRIKPNVEHRNTLIEIAEHWKKEINEGIEASKRKIMKKIRMFYVRMYVKYYWVKRFRFYIDCLSNIFYFKSV